jgi:endosialidase-like protein
MKPTIRILFATLALSSVLTTIRDAQAVVPPPDGGYPNGNTAEGQNALLSLSGGGYNTAVGFVSLRANTTGSFNTAVGAASLFLNTGDGNTATGVGALLSNTANENTANGTLALFSNTTGVQNTAVGFSALSSNTTAGANSSGANTAVGAFALGLNATGGASTAIGYAALYNATGGGNIALGDLAGVDVTTGSGNIIIANRGLAADANTIRIGNQAQTKCYIAGIRDVTTEVGDAIPVVIDSARQLGTVSSSKRFKKEIKPMDNSSEAILGLQPVRFQYKNDKANRQQFGLIAEQVADINPDLVVRNSDGEIYTVRYDAVNVMLLNEFLKEHRKVEKLEEAVSDLATQLREVSAELQKNNSSARIVADRHW